MPHDQRETASPAVVEQVEFMDFVAHELKQPMTSIQGYARMLMMGIGGDLSDTQKQFVEVINSNVDRMGRLVNHLLEISRLEAGRTTLNRKPVSVPDLVEEVVTLARPEIEARRHNLEVRVPDDLPPVFGDRERLIQILSHLVGNAYLYTPDGGTIRIVVGGQRGPAIPAGHVRISVRDTGIGMSPQDVVNLEEKFFRADHDLVQQQHGTGLGLCITRGLVELHGGTFCVESTVGVGSAFHVTLPVATANSE